MAADPPVPPRYCVVSVVGTRPEAIKMAPVLRALAGRPTFEQRLVLTGQHTALAGGFDMLPRHAVVDLAVDPAQLSAGELRETLHALLCGYLLRHPADLLLVQGDTTSALAGALAARDCAIPLGHVEAGLRSFDLQQPWPEEGNRIRIDELAALLFAPSEQAARHLAAEPRVRGEVLVTGNSGIDALLHARSGCGPSPPSSTGRKTVLVTCHRRENRGDGLRRICDAVRHMVATLPVEIVLPLHPNPLARRKIEQLLGGVPHVALIEPVGHAEMVRLIERCWIMLTDSGGLQEEGPAIGRPVLVLRNVTERPEAGASLELVGTDPERIVAAVTSLLSDDSKYARMAKPSLSFGDDRAAPRIADAVEAYLARGKCGIGKPDPVLRHSRISAMDASWCRTGRATAGGVSRRGNSPAIPTQPA